MIDMMENDQIGKDVPIKEDGEVSLDNGPLGDIAEQQLDESHGQSPKLSEIGAVMSFGGKQHFVRVGDNIEIIREKLDVSEPLGQLVVQDVSMAVRSSTDQSDGREVKFGSPYLTGASVDLEYCSSRKNKVISFKKRRRKSSSKTLRGYKQHFHKYRVLKIEIPEFGVSQLQEEQPVTISSDPGTDISSDAESIQANS